MFCDEPTSGLDAFMASTLISYLDKMARSGRTIICTIHQPSSDTFNMFKNLCLMADGRVAYMGELQGALEYFSRLGMPCPSNFNPADFYINQLAVAPGNEIACRLKVNRVCEFFQKISPKEDTKTRSSFINAGDTDQNSKYPVSCLALYRALIWRSALCTIREPILTYIRITQAIVSFCCVMSIPN